MKNTMCLGLDIQVISGYLKESPYSPAALLRSAERQETNLADLIFRQQVDLVGRDARINRDHGQTVMEGLSDQESVEWIAMQHWQLFQTAHHVLEYWQAGNTMNFALLRKIISRWCGKWQFAKTVFDDRLPD